MLSINYPLYTCRKTDNTVETPSTRATVDLFTSTISTTCIPAIVDSAPAAKLNQETFPTELYHDIRQRHWIYEDTISPPQKKTVQSELYQSVEGLSTVVSNRCLSQGELRLARLVESVPALRYAESEENEANTQPVDTTCKETVESALYQSIEDLDITVDLPPTLSRPLRVSWTPDTWKLGKQL